MVRIGIVGIGFMGTTHYKAIARVKGAKVTAVCTRDPKKLKGDWRGVQGNFGDDGGVHDLRGVAAYDRIEDLLADDRVDLVDLGLPTTLHYDWTLARSFSRKRPTFPRQRPAFPRFRAPSRAVRQSLSRPRAARRGVADSPARTRCCREPAECRPR